jgi:hypothetical protein
MALEPISTAYFINPSHQSVCLYVYPPLVAKQRLSKIVTAAMNTQATIEEFLDASFSIKKNRRLILPGTSCIRKILQFRCFNIFFSPSRK